MESEQTACGFWSKGGFRCAYCGLDLLSSLATFYGATCDHVHPKSKGGKWTEENMVACCELCNALKADYQPDSLEDAQAYVAARRAEYTSFFLQVCDFYDVDLPDAHGGEKTFQEDALLAVGRFASESERLMRRLRELDVRANAVLKRFATEDVQSPFGTCTSPRTASQ